MEFVRIQSIEDPLFGPMHRLMQTVFPPEEVLDYPLWAEPLQDQGLRVYVVVHEGEVVGATEYRFYPELEVAMTDFTIIGREGLGIGPFIVEKRQQELEGWAASAGKRLTGMFAEIYNPYLVQDHSFGGIKPMDPFVRREVLSHLGYRKLDFPYVHPSWLNDGKAVGELDLCFLSYEGDDSLSGPMIATFLTTYYAILEQKPEAWHAMVDGLQARERVPLRAF